MEQNNKYARGKIYTIRSHLTNKIYVGSTVNKLSKRFNDHKSIYKYHKEGKKYAVNKKLAVFEIFDIDFEGAYIELHHDYPCNNRNELNREEGKLIRELDCVNKSIAGRTTTEYYKDNRDECLNKTKQWHKNNPQYLKDYYQDNKEKQRNKYANNREAILAKSKEKYANNREAILAKQNRKIECQCGGRYSYGGKSNHLKTKKHQIFNHM
jgi:hypothetical protein